MGKIKIILCILSEHKAVKQKSVAKESLAIAQTYGD